MFDEEKLRNFIEDAVSKAMAKQDKQEYLGFWTTAEFKEHTGISDWDFNQKVLPNKDFQKNIRRFDQSRKFYIEVAGALDWLEKNMKVGNY